jgi:hypothetical protein
VTLTAGMGTMHGGGFAVERAGVGRRSQRTRSNARAPVSGVAGMADWRSSRPARDGAFETTALVGLRQGVLIRKSCSARTGADTSGGRRPAVRRHSACDTRRRGERPVTLAPDEILDVNDSARFGKRAPNTGARAALIRNAAAAWLPGRHPAQLWPAVRIGRKCIDATGFRRQLHGHQAKLRAV